MKDWDWQRVNKYPNHEKWDKLHDNVEMYVEGHGSDWDWKVSTVEGVYKRLDGHAVSLEKAKREAEGAAAVVRTLARGRKRK